MMGWDMGEASQVMYRIGPEWSGDGRSGLWMVETIYNVAVRVVLDESAEVVTAYEFNRRLDNAINETDTADDYLRGLDQREELVAIREKALAGRVGGATDGAPRKRTRKVATR